MSTAVEIVCGGCGVLHWMSAEYVALRRRDHKTWYCPNGCPRAYLGKSPEEKLRDDLAQAEKRIQTAQQQEARLYERIDEERRRTAAQKGQVTRLKNRAAAGVCPCCNRTFQNLARHMAGQHPQFRADEVAPDDATIQ